MMTTQKAVQAFWWVNVDPRLERFPECMVMVCWTSKKEIIYVDCQKQSGILKEERAGMPVDGDATQFDHHLGKVSFPVASRLRVSIKSPD